MSLNRMRGGVCLFSLALSMVQLPAAEYSNLWGMNGEAWSPRSRLPDFSYAGYHRGEKKLPVVENSHDVTQFGAVPNDEKDDTEAFQNAVHKMEKGCLFIPEGRYILSDFIDIRRSGVVLRGAGTEKTVLYFPKPLNEIEPNWGETTSGRKTSNYSWSGGFIRIRGSFQSQTLAHLSTPAERGARQLKLKDTSQLKSGQEVEIYQKDNSDNSLARHLYSEDPGSIEQLRGRTETFQVAKILKVNGEIVILDRPLRCDHRLEWKAQVRTFEPTVTESGIEKLRFEFPNTSYEGHFTEPGYNAIAMREVAHCWVRDVKIVNADSGVFVRGTFNTINGLILESQREPDPDRNSTGHHGVTMTGADNLLTDFDFRTCFIHDITVSHHTSGNVVSNGRGQDLSLDHHRYANFENLFTNLDAGKGSRVWRCGGGAGLGKHCGARGTFWNIRSANPLSYPPQGFGPWSLNLVGLETKEDAQTDENGKWFEVIPPKSLVPQNLHEAQLKKRTNGNRSIMFEASSPIRILDAE